MKYGIISDIHGNFEALSAVIKDAQRNRVETLLCAGDVVGYGASPAKCIELLQELKTTSVAGNHDWAVSGRLDYSYFTKEGIEAVNWTKQWMSLEQIEYLNALPLIVQNEDLTMVHGTLQHPEKFMYLRDIDKAPDTFFKMQTQVCFIGHTHRPCVFMMAKQGGSIYFADTEMIELRDDVKYIINGGSVGQPRDGIPMAAYCIYDTKLQMVEIKRVKYDVELAQHRIRQAGLPEILAQRIAIGQ